jgi:methionine sulfoxide reductase heme-binding subunit
MTGSGAIMVFKSLRSWSLFWVLAAVISGINCLSLTRTDFGSYDSTQAAIVRTMFYALPCLLAAFLASSLVRLWPGRATRWLLANRRYVGLGFSAGMVWHLTIVTYFLWTFGNHLAARDLSLDVIGLAFLAAMTVTSFSPFRSRLTPVNWRRLHTTGIYTLWFLPTFFFLEDFIEDHDPLYGVAAAVMISALGVRAAGWLRTRRSQVAVHT